MRRAGIAIGLALLALSGCKKREADKARAAPAPLLGSVTVEDRTAPGARPPGVTIDTTALAATARAKLLEAKVFSGVAHDGGAGQGPVARVRIDVGIEEVAVQDKAAARAGLRLRIDTRPAGVAPDHYNEDVQAGAETTYATSPPPDRPEIFSKLVSRASADLLTGYLQRQRLWTGSAADLRSAIEVGTGDTRVEAIRIVGERRLESEVPILLKLLGDPDEPVRDAALGALVAMKERRAVAELAKNRSMRDRREMRKILDAMAALGGPEAADYLSFVADGHEDEEIRAMAKAALERLKRRETP